MTHDARPRPARRRGRALSALAVTSGFGALGFGILAFAGGTVTDVELASPVFGGRVTIRHDLPGGPVETVCAHLWADDVRVAVGQQVVAGEVVGLVGAAGRTNGPHLHFELHVAGEPVDPEVWVQEHDPVAAAVWRVVPTTYRSRRRRVRRWLTGLV